jgi:adenosine deaminase
MSAAAPDWRAEPKVELHLHLEGAAPVALTRRLAAERRVDVSGLFDARGFYAWNDFTGFLDAYDRVAALYHGPEDARLLTEAVLLECAAHGVIYAEVILSPEHMGGGDAAAWGDYLAAAGEGARAAEARTGVVARWIATGVRHAGPDAVRRAAELAVGAGDPRIVGFGLAGDERRLSKAAFAPAFDLAREAGLGLTAHAGEFGGPQSVRDALDALRVTRIDHGVRAIEDAALVQRLAEEGVLLATAPGSNVALGVAADWASHPAPRLRAAGCRVTLSTDDPPFFRTTMTREYGQAATAWGWTAADLRATAADALAGAFCDAATKAALAPRLV